MSGANGSYELFIAKNSGFTIMVKHTVSGNNAVIILMFNSYIIYDGLYLNCCSRTCHGLHDISLTENLL